MFLLTCEWSVGLTASFELAILVVLYEGQTQWVYEGTNHGDAEVDTVPEEEDDEGKNPTYDVAEDTRSTSRCGEARHSQLIEDTPEDPPRQANGKETDIGE